MTLTEFIFEQLIFEQLYSVGHQMLKPFHFTLLLSYYIIINISKNVNILYKNQ